jgi:hypothetical protein
MAARRSVARSVASSSTYVWMPFERPAAFALAWIETNTSACVWFAIAVRSVSGTVASLLRVSTTSAPSSSRSLRARRRTTSSVTCFSTT